MPTSEQIEKARAAVQELASIEMNLSLADWGRISNTILESLTAAEGVKPRVSLEDVQRGYDAWAAKPHNAKWVRRINGTPIPNDLMICILSALQEGE
jgi:hypothetical protein